MTTFKSCNKEEFKELVNLYLNPRLHECECKWENNPLLKLMITNRVSHKCLFTVPFDGYQDDYGNVTCNLKDVLSGVLNNARCELQNIIHNESIYDKDWLKNINELSQIAMELKNWIDYLEKEQAYEREIES